MSIKVTSIKHGYLFGINTQTGERENLHYSKKIGSDFDIKEGSVIVVEFTKDKHQPKKITKVIDCKN